MCVCVQYALYTHTQTVIGLSSSLYSSFGRSIIVIIMISDIDKEQRQIQEEEEEYTKLMFQMTIYNDGLEEFHPPSSSLIST